MVTTLGLTQSEGRVATLLAEGLKVREIAATAGWSENYVRWLLQQVLTADALPRR